ncbi:MAG: toxin-antitoxin system HicB family antitoxin [Planctomycetota bacterium]|nr:MAG: toxin-antitoxin system HicB family antitoxin [Planctomycetota bacterium]REJ93907.1 MAG: toxin-antitoxin system HicB family antitoxin [Planctomycetota bacterium]REK20687.1 MAG: toxin-antitoxin system HicB family antitoxin [Planctomycetota bacterium]REK38131.1 MAG: toxin-antitoxin system HicB family antitoxin [Planctomycetota bacterium]
MSDVAPNPVTVHLPEPIRRRVEALAEREGITVEQFIASATGEKLAVWTSLDRLREEAASGRREDFDHFLSAVPDVEPPETDRFPSEDGD